MVQLRGRRVDTHQPVRVETEGETIARVVPLSPEEEPSGGLPWLAPGFVDIQINGYGGQEFASADLTPEKVGAIVEAFAQFGVTRCCPTTTTESAEVLSHAMRALAAACEQSPEVERRVACIHLEGPFISPDDGARGAHPLAHCLRPDWDTFARLQDAAGGRIGVLTLSPEFEESVALIEKAVESGLIVAIGHTSATPKQIREATAAGALLSTHLGNGSHPTIHRLRNYIWAQLAEDGLMASLIADGHHLPADVLKTFVRAKTIDRCILVSDISGQAGQPPGRYQSDFCEIEILPEGKLVVAGQRELLAGATQPIHVGIPMVMHSAGIGLAEAVRMATRNPARLLRLDAGGLEPGDRADLVQFDLIEPSEGNAPKRLDVLGTVIGGRVAWGTPRDEPSADPPHRDGSL